MFEYLPLPVPPEDLETFWRARRARAAAVEVAPRVFEDALLASGQRRLRIDYASTDGIRVGAWITLPAEGPIERGLVWANGYGGTAEWEVVPPGFERTAMIWPCLRGLGELSLSPQYPALPSRHVLHGIEAIDAYIHGGCVEDLWGAIDALCALVPEAAGRIDLKGASFGGGIAVMATAWDARIHSLICEVPSFGNHPLRVTIPCEGSGRAVRERWIEDPGVLDVLAYFDAASCARFVRVPVLAIPARRDPVVPPEGQWSIVRAFPHPPEVFALSAGHVEDPALLPEHAEMMRRMRVFLGYE